MRRRLLAAMVATTLAALLIPLVAGPASAHEEKTVGKYHFVVGFGDEPAYAGEKNSVQLILADANDKPVTDLTDTLKVEVTTGTAEPLQLAMEPNFEVGEFGTPGDYRAFFIPTAPGSYSFHFTGTIKGQKIDQTFASGPQTFSDIDDPAQVQYPVKQPTGGQLATRGDRETARINAALTAERDQANDDAASARTLAIIGLIVGALGLLAGIVALVRGRRSPGQAAPAAAPADTTVRQDR
ncbi:MAG TPA: hypothetical protein VND02_10405 [Actinomycetota bacterium]|nr:hypothetical protein [Actinomycetota bacterium]